MNGFLAFGVLLVALSIPMSGAGEVAPFLGLYVASMAPNVFLAGLAIIVFSVVRRAVKREPVVAAVTVLVTILLGVNTRLPSIISDLLDRNELRIERQFAGAVGQSVHIKANTAELWGRRVPYRSVAPACDVDVCLTTRGFRGAYTGKFSIDYWHENIVDTVRASGFSKASVKEKAPQVVVSEVRRGDILSVTMELKDANGVSLAHFNGRFRNGYPLETKDDSDGGYVSFPLGAVQYVLHGNFVSYWLSRADASNRRSPPASVVSKGSVFTFSSAGARVRRSMKVRLAEPRPASS